jgi:putative transcriptional regulator
MAKTTHRYESSILRSVHRSVAGLHRVGLVDEATMRKFDARCLITVSPATSQEPQVLRKRL